MVNTSHEPGADDQGKGYPPTGMGSFLSFRESDPPTGTGGGGISEPESDPPTGTGGGGSEPEPEPPPPPPPLPPSDPPTGDGGETSS